MYAVLDIETTGGQFNEEGITEIAIYRFDGHEITDQFISLVNPEIPIQPFVVKLTGINNAMLRSAPKFYEVAKRIIEITQDCVIVAHNTAFDYRILRTEFRRLGYTFEARTLCTVELAQKLLPEQPSHSLGKLVRALGIPIPDRHRASGDAMATLKLFKLLLARDSEKTIVKELIKTEVEKGISPKLLDIVESLPSKTGIYYIHREDGTIIFIGRSRNIKKRVNQHFTGTSQKCKKIQTEVFAVTYEETGSELIAILKEREEIKINRPVYSKPQTKPAFPWSLYASRNSDDFISLTIEKTNRKKPIVLSFGSFAEAKSTVFEITTQFNLDPQRNGLVDDSAAVFAHEETPEAYNNRVFEAIDSLTYSGKNLMLIDRGRTINERSAILIEDGVYKGYAFYDLNYQLNNIAILKSILIPMAADRDTRDIIQTYVRKNNRIKIVPF